MINDILIVLESIVRVFIFFGGAVLVGFISFMLIQLISYRIFGFNLYRKLIYDLFYRE